MVVTNPADEAAEMGPLISAGQRASVQGYLDEVDVAFAGDAPRGPGFWLPPSVVAATSPEQRIWREEVFGPVVAVLPFERRGRGRGVGQRHRVRAVRVDLHQRSRPGAAGVPGDPGGNLSVNSHSSVRYWTPFGGYKQSGLGRELGPDAPHAFTEEKNVFFSDGKGQ